MSSSLICSGDLYSGSPISIVPRSSMSGFSDADVGSSEKKKDI